MPLCQYTPLLFVQELQPSTHSTPFRLCYHFLKPEHFQGEKWNRTERLLGLHDRFEKERKGRQSRTPSFCEKSNKRRQIP
jgi:hypothetical protein